MKKAVKRINQDYFKNMVQRSRCRWISCPREIDLKSSRRVRDLVNEFFRLSELVGTIVGVWRNYRCGSVAQWLEQKPYKLQVAGSIPA